MTEWLPRYEMDTSLEDFTTIPSPVNPKPQLIGDKGFEVSLAWPQHNATLTHYIDVGAVAIGQAPIFDSLTYTPQRMKAYDTLLRDGQLEGIQPWQKPEAYWNGLAAGIVTSSFINEGYRATVPAALEAVKPFSVEPPEDMWQYDGRIIMQPEEALHALLDASERTVAGGDWQAAGALKHMTMIGDIISDGLGTIVDLKRVRDYMLADNGLAMEITGLTESQNTDFRIFSDVRHGIGMTNVGGITVNAMFTAPFLKAIETEVSTSPVSPASAKLTTAYKGFANGIRFGLELTQHDLGEFSQYNGTKVDLLDKIERYSGQNLRDLYE